MADSNQPSVETPPEAFDQWLEVAGADRRSGPGYTVWRDWPEKEWVDGIVSYDSYNGGQEIVPCVVVGIYLDSEQNRLLGLLIQKRLQDGLKDRFLIPLPRIFGLIDLTSGRSVVGDPSDLILHTLEVLRTRLASVETASSPVQASANQYAAVVTKLVRDGLNAGLKIDERALNLFPDRANDVH
ncbi:hypothetical protein OAG48_00330 [bacterium]|nr:hypothetical protein [bacterium]